MSLTAKLLILQKLRGQNMRMECKNSKTIAEKCTYQHIEVHFNQNHVFMGIFYFVHNIGT